MRAAITDIKSTNIGVSGGLGSSKTHGMCQWQLARRLMNKGSKFGAFTEPKYSLVETAAIPTWKKVLHAAGWNEGSDFSVSMGQPTPKLRLLRTNQEIHFLTASNPDLIVAAEYGDIVMDEAGDSPEGAFRNLNARLRCSEATIKQMMVGGAPQGITWFAKEFDSDTLEGWTKDKTQNHYHEEKKRRRFRLTTFDNPHVNGGDVEGYVELLRQMYGHNKNLVKSYIYGHFCPLFEGAAYIEFDPERHVQPCQADPSYDLYMTWDFNIELVWTAFQIQRYGKYGIVKRRYSFTNECPDGCESFDEAILEFIRAFPPFDGWRDCRLIVDGDRSGHAGSHKVPESDFEKICKELRKFYTNVSCQAERRVLPERGTVEAVNKVFSYDNAVIDPSLKGLIRGLQATRWKKHERRLEKPSGEDWTHRPDSIKYPIYRLEYLDKLTGNQVYGVNI